MCSRQVRHHLWLVSKQDQNLATIIFQIKSKLEKSIFTGKKNENEN